MAIWSSNATIVQFWPKLAFLSKSVPKTQGTSQPGSCFFQKISLTVVVLRWTMTFLETRDISPQKRRCPYKFSKKTDQIGQKQHFFGFLIETSPLLRLGAVYLRGIDRSTQNYKRKWVFWRKVRRAEIWRSNLGALRQQRSKLRLQDYNKKGKKCLQKNH